MPCAAALTIHRSKCVTRGCRRRKSPRLALTRPVMTCIDQNAFGVLLSLHDIENAEYSLAPEEFVERFEHFRTTALAHAGAKPLASGVSAIDLGHALYFEFEDGDQLLDPMSWLRE